MTRGGQRRWILGAASSNTFNHCGIFTMHILFKIMEHCSPSLSHLQELGISEWAFIGWSATYEHWQEGLVIREG